MSYGEFALWMTGIFLLIFLVAGGLECLSVSGISHRLIRRCKNIWKCINLRKP